MAKFIHVKKDHYLQGLPARDLEDGELDENQKLQLVEAVIQGIYAPAPAEVTPAPAGKKTKSSGETHDGTEKGIET